MANAVDAVMGTLQIDKRRNGGSWPRPPVGSRRFAILRVAKISGKGKMAAAAQHNLRERDTLNARPEDHSRNIHLAGARTADELMMLWEERAPEKIRKNAVHALEYVVTASPEKMAEMGQTRSEDYLRDALTWLQDKHGAENILSAVIHNDEITPHLQVMVIPLDDRGKLNARALVGGKPQLSAMQTDFAERVGVKYELDRGIERSGRRHETIRSYYGRATENETLALRLPERARGGFLGRGAETDAEYRDRFSEVASEAVRAVAGRLSGERDTIAQELAEANLRAADSEAKAQRHERSLKVLEVACNVANHGGPEQQNLLDEFQARYLELARNLPAHVRYAIDGILNEHDRQGFDQIEAERVAKERHAEAREISAARERDRAAQQEREARERAERQQDNRERDTGWER
ncbi:MobV family relaxase [Paracoccus sp. Ld10]|uniref:MobV family relaxase n=1 Tax=Paracoccus sp. Ld10 TaxID=649158 RepID=UPI0038648088